MQENKLIENVKQWGRDKELKDPRAQLNKVIEEVGEIAHEITRQRFGEDLKDALGDTCVTIIILADICGFDVMDCLEKAYNEIKNRKGETIAGSFVKDDVKETVDLIKDTYGDVLRALAKEDPSELHKEPEYKVIRNRCKCKKCGDVIESKSVHDFVRCKCGAIFTDGGTDYIHRGGEPDDIEEMDEWEELNDERVGYQSF